MSFTLFENMSFSRYKLLTSIATVFFVLFIVSSFAILVLPFKPRLQLAIIFLILYALFMALATNSAYTFRVANDVVVAVRATEPSDFKFEIENYNELLKSAERTGSHRIESSEFNAGGHSWVLVMYPMGNKNDNGCDHISLYLRLVNKPAEGGAVLASFKFFIFDKKRETYITISTTKDRRFDAAHLEWGIAQALTIEAFIDKDNGLLINNCCTIGAEVYVIKNTTTVARLPLIKKETLRTYFWAVYNCSTLNNDVYSPRFRVEGRSWKLCLYPKGNLTGKDRYLSLYLYLEDIVDLIGGRKLYVECTLSIRDHISGNDHKKTVGFWFDSSNDHHGFNQFLPLTELNNPNNGYRRDDTLFIEANLNEMFMLEEIT
ncbi:hypothetical protein Ancab_040572 [Ancistrocladus abbreviatus]